MFGHNARLPLDHGLDNKLAIQEIFPTIQGEGPFAGMPAVFVRLAGCNLACSFCDTEFSTGIDNRMHVDDVAELVVEYGGLTPGAVKLCVITGGEPFRQPLVAQLMQFLASQHWKVQVETDGVLFPDPVREVLDRHCGGFDRIEIVCSPKTSKVNETLAYCYVRHWKYVVQHDNMLGDGLPASVQHGPHMRAVSVYRPWGAEAERALWQQKNPHSTIWVSPCDDYDEARNELNRQAAVDSCLKHGYRLNLQIHKLIGVR